jgi:hypothetical protein
LIHISCPWFGSEHGQVNEPIVWTPYRKARSFEVHAPVKNSCIARFIRIHGACWKIGLSSKNDFQLAIALYKKITMFETFVKEMLNFVLFLL